MVSGSGVPPALPSRPSGVCEVTDEGLGAADGRGRAAEVRDEQGVVPRTGDTVGHEIACDFFCESGLAEPQDDQLCLTAFGQRLARRLIATAATGTVSLPPSVLDPLGLKLPSVDQSFPVTVTLGACFLDRRGASQNGGGPALPWRGRPRSGRSDGFWGRVRSHGRG